MFQVIKVSPRDDVFVFRPDRIEWVSFCLHGVTVQKDDIATLGIGFSGGTAQHFEGDDAVSVYAFLRNLPELEGVLK
jgi:hypothetical protein